MTIYVELLGEGTTCWRPVEACELELGRFKIESSEPEDENWMFKAGDIVECEPPIPKWLWIGCSQKSRLRSLSLRGVELVFKIICL
ncbi:MAG TPA: hypothetical protein VFB76_15235 [Candidatus Angelobacter sp.]|nr:hypothetical protein [Candidatus Angelobacter sp.]